MEVPLDSETLVAKADAIRLLGERLKSANVLRDNLTIGSPAMAKLASALWDFKGQYNETTLKDLLSRILDTGLRAEMDAIRGEIQSVAVSMSAPPPQAISEERVLSL